MKGIPVNQVHQRYLPVLFLSAHDPEDELLKQVNNNDRIDKYHIAQRG